MRIPFTDKEIILRRKASKGELSKIPAFSNGGLYYPFLGSRDKPMLLSTVYRCVDLISDSVAVLPLETFRLDPEGFKSKYLSHPAYYLLDVEPNSDMTRYVFFKTMVVSTLLTGNAFAYIERDPDLNVLQLVYIPSGQVGIEWILDGNGIYRKRYRVSGFKRLVEPKDMIHILNFSYDGIWGESTLSHARQTLGIASDSEAHAAGFFRSGANMSGILTIDGTRVNAKQKQQNYDEWQKRTNPVTGNPNGIVILEGNMRYQPITVSPKDSQLLESRLFNVQDICRFFSVSPVKAFDLSKSSYSTVEATQLQFLTDTVLPVITKIEIEINRKVFLPSERNKVTAEFNTSAILRTDKAAQGEYWNKLFQIGAATPNEVRREINLSRLENGDKAFVQVNVQTLDDAVNGKPDNNSGQTDGSIENDENGQE